MTLTDQLELTEADILQIVKEYSESKGYANNFEYSHVFARGNNPAIITISQHLLYLNAPKYLICPLEFIPDVVIDEIRKTANSKIKIKQHEHT